MSTAYPLAKDGQQALKSPGELARTRYDADALAGEVSILGLETDWLTVSTKEKATLLAQADEGRSAGYVQLYENADGSPVLAITYWKTNTAEKPVTQPKPVEKTPDSSDTTDDLYFRRGRTRPYSRKRKPDPNQMDLFGEADKSGDDAKPG